jgi:hypothetical protein
VPALPPLQDNDEIWDAPREILVGVRVQVRPVAGGMELVRATVPVKPSKGATVILDVPATPALTVTLVGAAVTEKSWTVKVTVAV